MLTIDATNYETETPRGKEVDAIYGDFVLRNDRLAAVVARPAEDRDANLTVRNVGGSVIDLTDRLSDNDQLSCFYPGGGGYRFTDRIAWPSDWGQPADGAVALAFRGIQRTAGKAGDVGSAADRASATIRLGYELRRGEAFLRVVTTLDSPVAAQPATESNAPAGGSSDVDEAPSELVARDGLRTDGDEFSFGHYAAANLAWAVDSYWGQAYGLRPESETTGIRLLPVGNRRRPRQIAYDFGETRPTQSITWRRRLYAAPHGLALLAEVRRDAGLSRGEVLLRVEDADERPVPRAWVHVTTLEGAEPAPRAEPRRRRDDRKPDPPTHTGRLDAAYTDTSGELRLELPPGRHRVEFTAQGHPTERLTLGLGEGASGGVIVDQLPAAATLEGIVTDGAGRPIPAKVQLLGLGETDDPDFGPPSGVRGVKNLHYTPNGRV